MKYFFLKFFLLVTVFTSPIYGQEITSGQVLIVGNSQNSDSMKLAQMYARQRHIPARNIIMLDVPDREDISRNQYNQLIAQPIRQFLHQQKLEDKIKILVMMYGLPLKAGAVESTTDQRALAQQVKQKYFSTFAELENVYGELEKMAGRTASGPTTLPGRQEIEHLLPHLSQIADKIQNFYRIIIPRLQQKSDQVEQQVEANEYMRLRLLLEGQIVLARIVNDQPGKNKEILDQLHKMETEYLTLQSIKPEKRDLDKTYKLAGQFGGLILELKLIYEDYWRLMEKDSLSAVDSELCLVLWDDYITAGRMPNALNPRMAQDPFVAGKGPTLMVSRLDGPNPKTVERMIRDSIATEKKGLQGTFYLDARGIKNQDGFFQYDQNLRDLARQIKTQTNLPVVLDDKPELFAPHSCPDTALYCGWYSLRNYIPAFTFLPGSVGYHIASFEATTLKQPKSNEWVKRMLEDGICATVGPVGEPFLDAFPLPSEFFGLLLTGKYTLAEVFFKTNRYNSWRMILIGDPLYRPFANNPLLTEKNIQLKPMNCIFLQ
ncbi:MAG: TIGR03790 family protein [Phycisphaerae bacterium]